MKQLPTEIFEKVFDELERIRGQAQGIINDVDRLQQLLNQNLEDYN
ncbi:MAG: hypothetical protein LBC87_10355 [Fibromonadaceae bacterium]|jgi:DNA-binding FrmR family transcriptional regulator|nr:hypothetical protein [Fibromonadaceae bacterium]